MKGAHTPTAAELLPKIIDALQSYDILLIKGSHGSKMYELAAALQHKEKKHAV